MTQPVLTFTEGGIYCPAGDFYIDPWRPAERAVITHGHSDHARSGHASYLATDLAAPVMRHRLGDIHLETERYGVQRKIGDALVSFHPAGHIPGSAQVRVEVGGEVWVASGDYKLGDDGLSTPFEPVRCHSFITECTFGLPVFRWPNPAQIAAEINGWWQANAEAGRVSMIGAYSLGKAQRLMALLDPSIGPILTHGAVEATNRIIRAQGIPLPETEQVAEHSHKTHPRALVIAPPSALGSKWAKRFGPAATAMASGWMQLRGVRRRRGTDVGFVLSDHADFAELMEAIRATGAESIYATHGYTEIFARWLSDQGWSAQVVPTEFGQEETAE